MSDVPIPEPTAGGRPGLLTRLMPLLTLIIAFSAIGLAIWEGLEFRRHNRLSVQPRVGAEVESGRRGDTEFVRLGMESNGLGPAVLTAFRIYFDGVVQDTAGAYGMEPWQPVLDALSVDPTISVNAQAFGDSSYLPVGREAIIFEATRPVPDPADSTPPLTAILSRLVVQICYCSIYGSDCNQLLAPPEQVEPQPCPAP